MPTAMARSRSASSRMMLADFPLSSRCTRLIPAAASSITRRPARTEPVSDTISTSGCVTIASPTSGPTPHTRLRTPSGRPASAAISAKMNDVSGATRPSGRRRSRRRWRLRLGDDGSSGAFQAGSPTVPAASRRPPRARPARPGDLQQAFGDQVNSSTAPAVWDLTADEIGCPTSLTIVRVISLSARIPPGARAGRRLRRAPRPESVTRPPRPQARGAVYIPAAHGESLRSALRSRG